MTHKATITVITREGDSHRFYEYEADTTTAAVELVNLWRKDPRTTLVSCEFGTSRRVWDCIGGHRAATRFAGTDHEEEIVF